MIDIYTYLEKKHSQVISTAIKNSIEEDIKDADEL